MKRTLTQILKQSITAASLVALLPAAASATPPEARITHGESACSSGESWTFSGAIPESKRDDFNASLRGKMAPVRGFSEALALRRFAQNPESRFLGEYWISRSLFDAKLVHIAYGGFVSIASRPVKAESAGIQLSAIECLLQIQGQLPSMTLPAPIVVHLGELRAQASSPQMQDIVWQAAGSALRAHLSLKASARRSGSDKEAETLLGVLKGAGAYEDFAIALRAAHENDHNSAVTHLDKFFAAPAPSSLKRYVNTAHILMARELYSLQQFDRANAQLKHVTKNSNELAVALEELSWAFLMNDRLSEAIGTAMNLNAGGLRHTYAPEAPMVMAMALNELCQYPESVRAIHSFKKGYEKSFQWLLKNASNENMYRDAIQFIRRTPGVQVPDRVASEWVRSPLFISSQDELNLLFEEKNSTTMLGRSGAQEQTKISESLLLKAKDLPQRLRAAKAKLQPGDHLPSGLITDLLALKDMILRYRRLQQGAPVWHTILANYRKSATGLENKLMSGINADLKSRSQRMLAQLEEIAENIQLIEVEIYNGASQDIIWQNAHPDFKKVAQRLKEDRKETSSSRSWDWGRAPAGDGEDSEVWEDELGSFNANLLDNCSSKDKYMALKSGRLAKE